MSRMRFPLLSAFLVTSLLATVVGSRSARAECKASDKSKIASYTKAAMDDFDLLEIESALKKLQRAIEYAEDKECDRSVEYADALLKKGIVHWRGQKDLGRCKIFMAKAIKANACVKLEDSMPPDVQRHWDEVKKAHSGYKCAGGSEPPRPPDRPPPDRPPDRPPPDRPPEPRAVDFGAPPSKPCEHTTVDEATTGDPIQMLVKVQDSLGAAKVIVFYKPAGESQYKKLPLVKHENGWAWVALIPSADVQGERLAYFIEVQNAGGTAICAPTRATSGEPEIVMLKAGSRRAGGCESDLPEEVCKANPNHPCCKKTDPGTPKVKRIRMPRKHARFYLNLGFALGVGYLTTGFKSFQGFSPQVAGFALGPLGGQVEMGYFVARRHLLSVAGKFGVSLSDMSETSVVSWQAMVRYRFFVVTGDIFGFYVGGELGGAMIFHSLAVGTNNEKDTFEHGFMVLGALVGVQIGSRRVGWFLEIDPLVILPKQTTFHLGVTTGVALKF